MRVTGQRPEEVLGLLRSKAAALPHSPGVYIMHGADGKVIYVGKSRSLRDRVSQYFHGAHDVKTTHMAGSVYDFEFIVCDTEMEALALENRLIKQYKPKYNIKLKDAKSYPYVRLGTDDPYPRLTMTRKRTDDNAMYFGPYSGVSTAFSIIHAVENVLRLPTCRRVFPRDIGRERPCLYYQMGKCIGVCTGKVEQEEYAAITKCAAQILRGGTKDAAAGLTARMNAASEDLRFEEAARCRDALEALRQLGNRQKAVGAPDYECDVIALAASDAGDCVAVFYVRGGYITDTEHFLFAPDEITSGSEDGEDSPMSAFLLSLYQSREYVPREILLSFPMAETEVAAVSGVLTERAGHKVTVRMPQRGEQRALCQMAQTDAARHGENQRKREIGAEETLIALASLLELEVIPERIECYDISNLGAEHVTAGMIVAQDGLLKKSEYRLFRIRTVSGAPDDYASMRETLVRRMGHLDDGGETGMGVRPDLILLDGGRGHVSVVREALREIGREDIPVYGMVKDDRHRTRALTDDEREYPLAQDEGMFRFVYQLQEEVHRYTVSHMSEAKRKTIRRSTLEKIDGIGPAKARALMAHFGTLAAVKEADEDALKAVKGITAADAERIRKAFSGEENIPES